MPDEKKMMPEGQELAGERLPDVPTPGREGKKVSISYERWHQLMGCALDMVGAMRNHNVKTWEECVLRRLVETIWYEGS